MANGIKKSDLIEEGALDAIRLDLDQMSVSLEKNDQHFKSIAKTLKSEINPTLNKTSKGIREINEQEIKSEKLLREKLVNEEKLNKVKIAQERLKQAELRTKVANNKESARQAKLTRDEIILNDKNAGTLEKLAAKNRLLSKERRTLNLETEKGRKRLSQINSELNRNNAIIEKNSDKLTKQRIGIGRYQKALSGLRSGLAKLGVAFGAAFIIRDTIGIVKDFEQAQADLASILGINVDEMAALTDQAKELGATTTFTASQVSELQKELAKLGFTQGQIEDMTVGVLALAEATGSDLAQSAEVAGAVINAFGLDAKQSGEVVDIMAKSFSSSSLDMQKFSVAMASVAPVAKTMGFNLSQTTAMLGTLTDSGLDASTAGTSLRNMMLEANKAGLTWQEALDKVNNSQDKAATSLELFGKRGVAAGVILAENQDKVSGLTDKLNDSAGAAEEMARVQRDTLGGALKEIRSAWEGYILGLNGATGASDGLKNVIKFLAQNLSTILNVIGKLTIAFAAFKTVVFSIKMADRVKEYLSFNKALKSGEKDMNGMSSSTKKLGQALKGIAITALITAVYELGKAWQDAASKAQFYADVQRAVTAAETKQGKKAEGRISAREKEFQDRINFLKLERSAGRITQEEEIRLTKEATEARRRQVDSDIKAVSERKKAALEELARVKAAQKAFDEGDMSTFVRGATGVDPFADDAFKKLDDAVVKARAKVQGLSTSLEMYRAENGELGQSIIDLTVTQNENTESTESGTKAVEDQTKARREYRTEIEKIVESVGKLAERRSEDLQDGVDEIQRALDLEIIAINEAVLHKRISEEDAHNLRIYAEIEALEARKALLEEYGQDTLEIEKELSEKRLSITEKAAEKEIEVETDKNEEIFNAYRNLQEALTQVLSEQIDERINLSKKEEDAAKSTQDYFQELAAQGNITAQQSIAEQIERQREAQQEQLRLEKLKQNVQMISAGLKTFTQALDDGDSPAEALATTLTTTQVLAGILGNLNFFATGTDSAPEGWAVVDEQGAEIVTDKSGNIKDLGTDGGARFKYLNQGDKVITANKSSELLNRFDQIGMSKIVNGAKDNAGNSYDLMMLQNELKGMRGDMSKLQTQINVDWQGLASGMAQVNVHTNKGGDKRTERYNIR